MDRTEVTCTDTDNTIGADVLERSGRHLKVAIDGMMDSLTLTKGDPHDRYYVGTQAGFEFTSTGD